MNRLDGELIDRLAAEPINRPDGEPIDRLKSEPINRLDGKPTNKLDGEPINWLVGAFSQLLHSGKQIAVILDVCSKALIVNAAMIRWLISQG